MNKKLISLAIAGAVAAPFAAQAGSITVANQDITLSGGITGAYLFATQDTNGTAPGTKQDVFSVPDTLLNLSSDAKTGGVGFTAGIGSFQEYNLRGQQAITGSQTNNGFGVQYGWVSAKPIDGLTIDLGRLATNVGYEVSPSYQNANILLGLVWAAQPTYYNGVRATYSMNGMNFYAEVNKNAGSNTGAGAGASGNFSGVNIAVNYLNNANAKTGPGTILDAIASTKVGNISVGVNFDYLLQADAGKTTGADDNAYGAAVYASMPVMDKVSLPVRVEIVHDGTSGLYGGVGGHGISFTVTPTYNFTDSTFVRAEFDYVTASNKVYNNKSGNPKDSQIILGVQGGVRF